MNPTDRPLDSEEPPEFARVEFPDSFKEALAAYIPNGVQLVYFLEDGVRREASRRWPEHLWIPGIIPGWGWITTQDGYQGVPALVLWFWSDRSLSGEPFLVFNRVEPKAPLDEAEDLT